MAEATSELAGISAPRLVGQWLHAVADPAGTERSYLHLDSDRAEGISVQAEPLRFNGRRFPVFEYGEQEEHTLEVALRVPFSASHDSDVEALREALRARRVLCYRDNRGRLLFGVLGSDIGISDQRDGTVVDLTLNRVDYDEAI